MKPYTINSISELHRLLELPPPRHPLISVFRFEDIKCFDDQKLEAVAYNFYCVALKKNFSGSMRYGHRHYDFDEGTMHDLLCSPAGGYNRNTRRLESGRVLAGISP